MIFFGSKIKEKSHFVALPLVGITLLNALSGLIYLMLDSKVNKIHLENSFEWFNNSTPWVGISVQDTLCPGDYIVTITDVNGNLVNNSYINILILYHNKSITFICN